MAEPRPAQLVTGGLSLTAGLCLYVYGGCVSGVYISGGGVYIYICLWVVYVFWGVYI